MPNIKSAKKRVLIAEANRMRNKRLLLRRLMPLSLTTPLTKQRL